MTITRSVSDLSCVCKWTGRRGIKYLLLTEFEVRTVSYGSVNYRTHREDEVSKIFVITLLCVTSSGTISMHEERLQISEASRKQNESI